MLSSASLKVPSEYELSSDHSMSGSWQVLLLEPIGPNSLNEEKLISSKTEQFVSQHELLLGF